mmetsp:Transcript_18732/g.26112  ORF Transcript_18732/g.26112 Transcript_18732/m.26112 type:complete len:339 (+) Transcript_18732:69-1085(+)|eukprot:CAMPEP_0184478096 /NCGR_PEP_ID=MMETSP0113_2-20130426/211_1 /TAXON_ID=91329 /ORGANISM="Norrisiella sphaerica, Strain BC52" /LENGTH=338 /DNA_ID=CAMNT_0026855761 /DNA_START=63 /DNA_END=1079 /DNA_ORIENTATION=+
MAEKKKPYGTEPPLESKELTKEELELKKALRDANKDHPCNATTTDDTVIRFIRGYCREKDPIKTTHERYKEMLDWRKEGKIDEDILKNPEDWKEYNKHYKHFIYGRDKLGRPVCYEQLGKLEPNDLVEFGMDKLEAGHVRFMEELTKLKWEISRQKKTLIYKHVHVIDLDGFGWKHMGSKFYGSIKKIMHIDSHYYPETLQKLFILNSSMTFRTLWAVVKGWVHPLTRERIVMLGYDKEYNLKQMLEFVDEDQIPEYLGGKNKEPMVGICHMKFDDIDYKTEPAVWKGDSEDPRAIYLRDHKPKEEDPEPKEQAPENEGTPEKGDENTAKDSKEQQKA